MTIKSSSGGRVIGVKVYGFDQKINRYVEGTIVLDEEETFTVKWETGSQDTYSHSPIGEFDLNNLPIG